MSKISSVIALEDKMTPTLSKIEHEAINQIKTFEQYANSVDNMKKSLEAVERANPKIVGSEVYAEAAQALEKMEGKLYDVAEGNDRFNTSLENTKSVLPSVITSLVSWAAVIKGVKGLVNLSDATTQTTARIDMMNDGLQTTAELQDEIFKAAQRSRVGYQGMASAVAKLGTQAGEAFGNNSKQIVQFSELLNKVFTTAGMDESSIQSVMYNMTQSLSSGRLLGQDYRILKQNAPQMIQYLRDYYKVSQAELDELVSKGKVSAEDLKNAMFASADKINSKFSKMPVTFAQAWTKFKNTFTKILEPIAKMLSKVADWLDKIFTFLGEHQYILYIMAAAIGLIAATILIYNTYTTIATIVTMAWSSAMGMVAAKMMLIIAVVAIVAAALLYLWNTNDEAAGAIIYAWDMLQLGMKVAALGIKTAWYGIATFVESIAVSVLIIIQDFVNGVIGMINGVINMANKVGAGWDTWDKVTFGDQALGTFTERIEGRAADLANDAAEIEDMAATQNATRDERVANRKKIGMSDLTSDLSSGIGGAVSDALTDSMADVTGSDGGGGKAIKTTSNDKLIDDNELQLLLDVATRDYKLNYQQVTPNITLTFGDVRETADVDELLDKMADRLEEIYDGNLGV